MHERTIFALEKNDLDFQPCWSEEEMASGGSFNKNIWLSHGYNPFVHLSFNLSYRLLHTVFQYVASAFYIPWYRQTQTLICQKSVLCSNVFRVKNNEKSNTYRVNLYRLNLTMYFLSVLNYRTITWKSWRIQKAGCFSLNRNTWVTNIFCKIFSSINHFQNGFIFRCT